MDKLYGSNTVDKMIRFGPNTVDKNSCDLTKPLTLSFGLVSSELFPLQFSFYIRQSHTDMCNRKWYWPQDGMELHVDKPKFISKLLHVFFSKTSF